MLSRQVFKRSCVMIGIVKIFMGMFSELSGNPPPKSYETVIEMTPAGEKDQSVATFHDVSTADQNNKVDAV